MILIKINSPQTIIIQWTMTAAIVAVNDFVVGISQGIVNVYVIDVAVPEIAIGVLSFLFVKSN